MKKNNKLLWGLFFIAAAVMVVINQLGFFINLSVWSLLVVIMMVPVITHGIRHRNFFNIFFGLAILLIIFQHPLGIQKLVPWTVLAAALLLSIGFSILIKPKHRGCHHSQHWGEYWAERHNSSADGAHSDDYDDEVNSSVSFGESSKYVHSENFRAARLDCSFGHLSVYFDGATLHPDGAEIFVNLSFGSVELYLPHSWNTQIGIDTSLAAVDEKPRQEISVGPPVRIIGAVSVGAVEITYI